MASDVAQPPPSQRSLAVILPRPEAKDVDGPVRLCAARRSQVLHPAAEAVRLAVPADVLTLGPRSTDC